MGIALASSEHSHAMDGTPIIDIKPVLSGEAE